VLCDPDQLTINPTGPIKIAHPVTALGSVNEALSAHTTFTTANPTGCPVSDLILFDPLPVAESAYVTLDSSLLASSFITIDLDQSFEHTININASIGADLANIAPNSFQIQIKVYDAPPVLAPFNVTLDYSPTAMFQISIDEIYTWFGFDPASITASSFDYFATLEVFADLGHTIPSSNLVQVEAN